MKPCCVTSMTAIFLLLCSYGIQAQTKQPKTNRVSLENTEQFSVASDEFIRNIQMRNYEGLKFVSQIFEGETHISVYSTALTNGLKTIFKR